MVPEGEHQSREGRAAWGTPKKCCSWCLFNVDSWGSTLPRLDWELSSAIFFPGFHRNPGPSSPADSLQISGGKTHQNLMVYHHHNTVAILELYHIFRHTQFFLANPCCWWPIPLTIPIVDGNIPSYAYCLRLKVETLSLFTVDWHRYDIPIYCWLDTNLVRCRTVFFDHPAVFAKTLRPSTLVAAQRF